MTLSVSEAGGTGRNSDGQATARLETTPGRLSLRPADEIFSALGTIGLLHYEGDNATAQFMQGEIDALESFFETRMDEGWPVLKSGIELSQLSRQYDDLRQLQRNGHLVGSLGARGRLAGLGWGLGQRSHLYERLSGGRYKVIHLKRS
jgi:hypothetical protein